jgi:hypothetical protein
MSRPQSPFCEPRSHGNTRSWGAIWYPRIIQQVNDLSEIEAQLARATPANSELLEWAAKPTNQPPQQWWDEEDDPFEPTGD